MRFRIPKDRGLIERLDGEALCREDFRYLYMTGPEKLSFQTIAIIFDCTVEDIYAFARKNHIDVRKDDSYSMKGLIEEHKRDVDRKAKEFEDEQRKREIELWKRAQEIYGKPKPEPTEYIVNGKIFRDYDLVKGYNREVQKIYAGLITRKKEHKVKEFVRSVDLSAMRLHRGLDMFAFSQKSKIPYKSVVYYEKTKYVVVPKEISDVYFRVLNISRSEFKKIRECLSGKRRDMFEEENRIIPDNVKTYVWERDKGKCKECGREKFLHFHHIEHYSDGGRHQARNLVLLCVSCHAERHRGEKGYGMLKAQAEKLLGGESNGCA